MSAHIAIADFIAFMESNGVKPAEEIASRLASGALLRFRCEGDGKARKNGWAILYLDDRPAGAFGNYKANTGTLKWKSGEDRPALSQAERDALQREWRMAKDRRESERNNAEQQAALDAGDMWSKARTANPDHEYAARKMLDTAPLRQVSNLLLVPMYGEDGTLWNIQRIASDGEKRFLRGGRVDDMFCIIGDITPATREVGIAEGYATASAIWQASGLPCIAAFSAKNMIRVARLWHERRPDLQFIICGDDDRATETKTGRNPGRESAIAAAQEIGAKVAFPMGRAA